MRVIFPIPAELRADWIFQLTEGEHRKGVPLRCKESDAGLCCRPLFLLLFPV